MPQDIFVPDIGDFHDVEVIEVLVKVGDRIEVESPLITIETEKATMDVPATAAGVVQSIKVKKGDRVSKGSLILVIDAAHVAASASASVQQVATTTKAAANPTASTTAAVSAAIQEMQVPDIGDFHDVEVIDVLVKVGDHIQVDTALMTIETEKATMDVPATAAGVVQAVKVAKGARVSKGSVILSYQPTQTTSVAATQTTTTAAPVPTASAAPRPATTAAPVAASTLTLPVISEVGFARAYASPSVRKLARELGVDLSRVQGSGIKNRITPDDVKAWVKQALSTLHTGPALPQVPEVDFAKFGAVEVQPLGRIQKISGARLHASWINVPHVWQMDEADITELEKQRKKLQAEEKNTGVKLTLLAFLLRACVLALRQFPTFNASLDAGGQNLVLKNYLHIGFAADTPNGLMVPVIRDVDKKNIGALAQDLTTLSTKARTGKLTAAEMQGGCFTISSLGGIGGAAFTPIINAPEVAILGVSRAVMKPVFVGDQFVPRLILPFTLAYDHRVIDGALGARFTTYLAQQLHNAAGLLDSAS